MAPPYNAEWEARIHVFRKNRRLLVARGIPFNKSRAAFETDVRAKLTKPGSVTFFWPPSNHSNPNRHQGWVMLAFDERRDRETAETDLGNYKFGGRQIRVDRASKVAVRL